MMTNNLGIYIHIPFCVRKCPYCGFLSAPVCDEAEFAAYKARLVDEIKSYEVGPGNDALRRTVDSIFIGGGTPSIMPAEYIAEILLVVNNKFYVTSDCEITMEANPGTLTEESRRSL